MNHTIFSNSKILVVGGAGFVGSNLSHTLLSTNSVKELWIVDNLLSSDIINLPDDKRVRFILGSIADNKVLRQLPVDLEYVFHLACFHGNQSSIADPLADHANNTFTTLKLFDTLRYSTSLKKIVYAAAGCAVAEKTYDSALPTTEDAPVSLFHDSPYSISKIVGEMYGNFYFQQYNLPFVKARFQNVFGPREILGAGQWRGTVHTVWRNVIPTFIWKALHQKSLPLDNNGKSTRDFIYVDDICRGLLACADNGDPGQAYNLASGVETTILDLACTINEITDNPTSMTLQPPRNWDRSGKRFASTKKSSKELGFRANTSIYEGIQKTVKWTINNKKTIESAIERHRIFMTKAD